MKLMDGEEVKERVGADRAVTEMLYHYFVSVLTQERVLILLGLFIFLFGSGVV